MSSHLPFSTVEAIPGLDVVYCIGGGTSIEGFDFSRLNDGFKLGANKAGWLAKCDAITSLDQNFVRHHQRDIEAMIADGKKAYLVMPIQEDGHTPIKGATYCWRYRDPGLSMDRRWVNGVHSGYSSIGVAYHLGAKEIRLLGFDMQYGKDNKTHFHDGYAWHNRQSHRFMNKWANNFQVLAENLRREGVRVVNYIGYPKSLIPETDFEQKSIEELML